MCKSLGIVWHMRFLRAYKTTSVNPFTRTAMVQEPTENAVLLTSRSGNVVTLTLNRPKQFNALSEALLDALHVELTRLREDSTLQCVVLEAQGKAFCAGHDLKQMRANPEQAYYEALFSRCSEVMQAIVNLPVPVIAKVHGMATAAGCQLVASCDLVVASDAASFAVSGINVGLFCSTPAVALTRAITHRKAFEMLITGEFISAEQAQHYGLVNRVVSPAVLEEETQRLVELICAKSPVAVRTGKAMVKRQAAMPLSEAYAYAGAVMAENMMAEDAGEGIDAFIEKRAPHWTGR